MGIRFPSYFPVSGSNCPHWIVPADTPETVYALFIDIVTCPAHGTAPNGHVFALHQKPTNPCFWENDAGSGAGHCTFSLQIIPPLSLLFLEGAALESYFYGGGPAAPPEHSAYSNSIVSCVGGVGGHSGSGMILWGDAAREILDAFVIPDDPDTMMEVFLTPDLDIVYKFCLLRHHMNLKFKIAL